MSAISCFMVARSSAGRPRQAAATLKKVYLTNWRLAACPLGPVRGPVWGGLLAILVEAPWQTGAARHGGRTALTGVHDTPAGRCRRLATATGRRGRPWAAAEYCTPLSRGHGPG